MFYLYYFMIENEEDCEKFDRIIEEHERMMFRVMFSITKDKMYAEEAMQSALVSIARNISHIETDNPIMLKSYIYTVAENAGIDAWRRKMRESRVLNIDEFTNISIDDRLIDKTCNKENMKKLLAMLRTLKPSHREVVVLSLLHGHSLCQIADELDKNYSTVRKHLERGKKKLAKMIKEAGFDD